MGMFQVDVRVANPLDRSQFFDEKFWVDTGAFHSVVPEDRLQQIGLQPLRTQPVVLADGRHDRLLLGEAVLTIAQLQSSSTCPVLFGSPGSLFLLGATALEFFGVHADPTTQTLKPVAVILAGVAES